MFYRFYPHFKNLLIRSNYISHLFTSTNQEIVFDQSQFISVLFLVYSLAFPCCVSVFLGILLYLILSPVSFYIEIIIA